MEKRKQNTDEKMRIAKEIVGTSSVADQEHIAGIPGKPGMRHVHVIGNPSTGMSKIAEDMIMADIKKGHGVAFIDLHGNTAKVILDACPPSSQNSQAAKEIGQCGSCRTNRRFIDLAITEVTNYGKEQTKYRRKAKDLQKPLYGPAQCLRHLRHHNR